MTPRGERHVVRVYVKDAHGETATHPDGIDGRFVSCPCGRATMVSAA